MLRKRKDLGELLSTALERQWALDERTAYNAAVQQSREEAACDALHGYQDAYKEMFEELGVTCREGTLSWPHRDALVFEHGRNRCWFTIYDGQLHLGATRGPDQYLMLQTVDHAFAADVFAEVLRRVRPDLFPVSWWRRKVEPFLRKERTFVRRLSYAWAALAVSALVGVFWSPAFAVTAIGTVFAGGPTLVLFFDWLHYDDYRWR